MRAAFLLVLVMLGAGAYLERDRLTGLLQRGKPMVVPGAAEPAVVYQWQDAQGKTHFGDAASAAAAGAGNARRVSLQPANTVKGMSQAQIDAALKPKAQAHAAPSENCEPEDAACMRRDLAPRNLAIENMEAAGQGKSR